MIDCDGELFQFICALARTSLSFLRHFNSRTFIVQLAQLARQGHVVVAGAEAGAVVVVGAMIP